MGVGSLGGRDGRDGASGAGVSWGCVIQEGNIAGCVVYMM